MKKIITLENFIWLISAILPVYLVRFPGFNLLDILIGIVFLWWLGIKENKAKQLGEFICQNKIAVVGLGLIIGGLFLGLWKTSNIWPSLGIIKSWFILPFILGLLFRTIIPEERRGRLFAVLFLSSMVLSLISWAFYFSGIITYDGRLSAIFSSPNYLFMNLAVGFISGLIWFRESFAFQRASGRTIFISAGLLSILAVLFLTKSYTGTVALFVAVLFLTSKIFSKRRIVISLLLLVLASFLFFEKESDKFSDLGGFNNRSSLVSREIIWMSSFRIIADNWFLGIGAGNFQEKYLEYQKFFPPYLEWAVPHPHNLFLAFWLNSGLIGLLGFVILLWGWKGRDISKNKKLLWGAWAIMIYFILHGLLDTTYFKNDLACFFWLIYFL